MNEWKNDMMEYQKYCKPEFQEAWVLDIQALDMEKYYNNMGKNLGGYAYEAQKVSFIKTAEIMKSLDEGESWEQVSERIMEGRETCQYPIGIIGHMMLKYSKHGIDFVKTIIGDALMMFNDLNNEFEEAVKNQNKEHLEP